MLNNIPCIRSHVIEIAFFLNSLAQSQNSKERIIEFMPDAGSEHAEAARLFRLNELVLNATLVGRVTHDQAQTRPFSRPPIGAEPLVVVDPLTETKFAP